jgi:acetylornithine deacetylase/succinyl-diaminopimelate desuccinylase-like protein
VSPSSLLPNLAPHGDNNVHTVDESTQIDALAKAHEWYSRLMRAVQDVRE